jgi:hypothetical protein
MMLFKTAYLIKSGGISCTCFFDQDLAVPFNSTFTGKKFIGNFLVGKPF